MKEIHIGPVLEDLMKKKGIGKRELATKIGRSAASVTYMLREGVPSLHTLIKLGDALGTDLVPYYLPNTLLQAEQLRAEIAQRDTQIQELEKQLAEKTREVEVKSLLLEELRAVVRR